MTAPTPRRLPAPWATPKAPPASTGLVLSPLPLTGAAAAVLRQTWGHLVDLDGPAGVALAFDTPHQGAPWGKMLGQAPDFHDLGRGCGLVVGPAGEALAFRDLAVEGTGDHCALVPIPLRLLRAPGAKGLAVLQAWVARAPLRVSFIGKGVFPIWGGVLPPTDPQEIQTVADLAAMVTAGLDLHRVDDVALQGVRHPAADGWASVQPGRLEWQRGRNPSTPRSDAFRSLMAWAARDHLDLLPVRHTTHAGKPSHRGFVEDVPGQRTASAHARAAALHAWMDRLQKARAAWAKVFPEFDALLDAAP